MSKEFNIELAEKVLGHVKLHPERHIQSNGYQCMMGWVVRLSDGDRAWMQHHSTQRRAAEVLGMSPVLASTIYGIMGETAARDIFAIWIRYAKVKRWMAGQSPKQIARFTAKEEKATRKAMAKADKAYQKRLDHEARQQIRDVYAMVEAERQTRTQTAKIKETV